MRTLVFSWVSGRRLLSCLVVAYVGLVILAVAQTGVLHERFSASSSSSHQHSDKHQPSEFFDTPSLSNHKQAPARKKTTVVYNPNKTVLALLYPQGMIGGYRNQVIRFTALVARAQKLNTSQLLLPSILWSTTYKMANDGKKFFPAPMEMYFDIEHWNSYRRHLPVLVSTIQNSDCWDTRNVVPVTPQPAQDSDMKASSKGRGLRQEMTPSNSTFVSPMMPFILNNSVKLRPVVNQTLAVLSGKAQVRVRKLDLSKDVENCTNPFVYGGGTGAGRLWNDFMMMPKAKPGDNSTNIEAIRASQLISWISRALQPSPKWREVAHQCIHQHQPLYQSTSATADSAAHSSFGSTSDLGNKRQTLVRVAPYVALHARIEVDMMIHKCGRNMEKNLTKILSMVETFTEEYNLGQQNEPLRGIFIAVSRHGMKQKTKDKWVRQLAEENWDTLLARSSNVSDARNPEHNPPSTRSEVFECGEMWMNRWYAMQNDVPLEYYGSLLPSILNFYIATHATIFVGVAKSSWSTDVWTTRYYLGKGDNNFEYTTNGIHALPHGGLPNAHKNC